jgi:hypothetical protein
MMQSIYDTDTAGREFRLAPNQSTPPGTGTIHGVWAYPNQEVEWIWTHTPGGSFISGYTIKPKGETNGLSML